MVYDAPPDPCPGPLPRPPPVDRHTGGGRLWAGDRRRTKEGEEVGRRTWDPNGYGPSHGVSSPVHTSRRTPASSHDGPPLKVPPGSNTSSRPTRKTSTDPHLVRNSVSQTVPRMQGDLPIALALRGTPTSVDMVFVNRPFIVFYREITPGQGRESRTSLDTTGVGEGPYDVGLGWSKTLSPRTVDQEESWSPSSLDSGEPPSTSRGPVVSVEVRPTPLVSHASTGTRDWMGGRDEFD